MSGASEFLSAWYKAAPRHEHTIVKFELVNDEEVILERIQVWPESYRGTGLASLTMATICLLADRYRVRISGHAKPYGFEPDADEMVIWLRKFGFEAEGHDVLRMPS